MIKNSFAKFNKRSTFVRLGYYLYLNLLSTNKVLKDDFPNIFLLLSWALKKHAKDSKDNYFHSPKLK